MSIPDVEDVQQMDVPEIDEQIKNGFDQEREYTLEQQKQWFEIFITRHRKANVDKPDLYREGALIVIEYVTGDEEIIPYTSRGGTIVSAEDDLLVVKSDELPENYHLDLDELELSVELLVDESEVAQSQSSPGYIVKLKLIEPPWGSEFDDIAAGVSMGMMYSGYEWVNEGVYSYPPEEFFEGEL